MVNSGKVTTFESIFPLLAVENDCIISKQGDITVGFKVKLPEIFTVGSNEYETIHSNWLKATLVLPEYTILHKQDWILKENYVPNVSQEGMTFLSKSFERHFDGRPVIQHTCYLFLTKTSKQQMRRTSTFTSLTTGNIAPRTSLDKDSIQNFLDAVGQFQSIVQESGFIELEKLTDEDYLGDEGILQKHISLQKPKVLEDFIIQDDSTMFIGDDELCLHTLSHLDDLGASVKTESRYAKLCTDKSDCMLSFATPLTMLLPCNHMFNQYLFIENHEETKKRLERKAKNMFSLGKFSRANIINQELVNDYLNTAEEFKLTSCYAHCNVIAWSDDKEELKRVKNEVGSQLALMGCKPRHNKIDVPTLFFAALPGNEADFPSEERFLTFPEHAICLFSQETSYQSSASKFGFKLVDPLTTKPIHVDISDYPRDKGIIDNRNKVVLGGSGTGKSFLMNHMIRQYYDQDAHIILVDMGNSYQGICELIRMQTNGDDGIYFTYKESEPISFNPFYTEDGVYSMDKKETLKTIILQLWKRNKVVDVSEDITISTAIEKYIERIEEKAYAPSFNSFYEFMQDDYGNNQLKDVRAQEFDLRNFLYVLKPFYKGGTYDYLLNSTLELDLLQKRFIVFEIDQLKDHKTLFPIVTLVIMEAYLNKVRRLDGIRKVLLLEEAWKAIASESMATYVHYLFKTVRKQFGEIIVVSQELDDLISSKVVKEAIIANSGCKILLNQSNNLNKFDAMQTAFGFTDNERAQICTIGKSLDQNRNYKQVWIGLGSSGKYSKVYDVEVSMEEGIAYSTEQTEKVELYNLVAQNNGDLELSLSQLADKKRKERAN